MRTRNEGLTIVALTTGEIIGTALFVVISAFGLFHTYARGHVVRRVFLGTALIGAVVFGWLGLQSAPTTGDIQDAYVGLIRVLEGLV